MAKIRAGRSPRPRPPRPNPRLFGFFPRCREFSFFPTKNNIAFKSLPAIIKTSVCPDRGLQAAGLGELKRYAPHLISTLIEYEGNYVLAHGVLDGLGLLIQWLETSADQDDALSDKKETLQKSAAKLRSHLLTDLFRQPATGFFRACQRFDSRKGATMRMQSQVVVSNIPWFEDDDKATDSRCTSPWSRASNHQRNP